MVLRALASMIAALAVCPGGAVAQSAPQPSPLDAVPEKLAFNIPYGASITADRAQAVIQAASAEATKRGWPLNIAVVDSGANLVAFLRMDGAQLASIPHLGTQGQSRGEVPAAHEGL